MPRTANKKLYVTHRALSRGLARLAPFYRERIVVTVAIALASGTRNPDPELLRILSPAEMKHAHRLAAGARQPRETVSVVQRLAQLVAATNAFAFRVVSAIRRRNK